MLSVIVPLVILAIIKDGVILETSIWVPPAGVPAMNGQVVPFVRRKRVAVKRSIMVSLPESEAITLLEQEIAALKKEIASQERKMEKLETKLRRSEAEEREVQDALAFYYQVRELANQHLNVHEDCY